MPSIGASTCGGTTGAAAAGPFEVDQAVLDQMITRVVAEDRVAPPSPQSVH